METKISIIQDIINELKWKEIYNFQFSLIKTTFSQIITAFQIIYDILEKTKIAITFSKLYVFHNSIVEQNELLKAIQSITTEITGNKLPFPATLENI